MPSVLPTPYPFDPTGTSVANKITNEQQILTAANFEDYHFVIPSFAPYFADGLIVTIQEVGGPIRPLVEGLDYYCTLKFIAASRACAKPIYGSISMLDLQLAGIVRLTYQTLGGDWTQNNTKITEILADRLHNPRITAWDVVVDMPYSFPVIDHEWDLVDMVGMSDINSTLTDIAGALAQAPLSGLNMHLSDNQNPHHTSASQVGAYSKFEIDDQLTQIRARLTALEN